MPAPLDPREYEMLRLLEQGASSNKIAGHFGLTANSVRYYLRMLYKKLDVKNGIAAVAWYTRMRTAEKMETEPARARFGNGDFGNIALKSGLLNALGAASWYIGATDAESRELWEWLLAGHFDEAADFYRVHGKKYTIKPVSIGAVPLAALLLLGGHLEEGRYLLSGFRLSGYAIESAVLHALYKLLNEKSHSAWFELYCLTADGTNHHPAKHLAMIVQFHLYSRLAYFKEARMTAEAIGDEADAVKLAAKSRSGMALGQVRDLPLPPG